MTRRPTIVSTLWSRMEPVGFDGSGEQEIEYEVSASLSPYHPGTHEDPPEGGEVDIETVHRIDPFTKQRIKVPDGEWPFEDREYQELQEQLANEVPLYDYDEDPPARDEL